MKELISRSEAYIRQFTWKDVALLKLCLCSMGILLGLSAPRRWRKGICFGAAAVFLATYLPLMLRFLPFLFPKEE